jgi:hypothetical protein
LFFEWIGELETDLFRSGVPPPDTPLENPGLQAYRALETQILSLKATVLYLHHLRLMYVNYGMSKFAIISEFSPQVIDYLDGFEFFEEAHADWAAIPFVMKSHRNRHWMSDTTWSQMKMSWLGKLKLMRLHFSRHPDRPLYPRWMTSSIIEALFGRIRSYSRGTGSTDLRQYCIRRAHIDIQRHNKIINGRHFVAKKGSLLFLTRRKSLLSVMLAKKVNRAKFQEAI